MATSNRAASTWTPQLIGKTEEFFNQGSIEELLIRNNLFYYLLKMKGRVRQGEYGHTQTLTVNQTSHGGVTWFDHLDAIASPVLDGPQAASWYRSQCAKGFAYSATQEADNKGGNVDLLAGEIEAFSADFLKDFNLTLIRGQGSSAKQPEGLETAIFAETHVNNSAEIATTSDMRQAANTYAGIARTASGGTGWENVSVSLDATDNTGYTGTAWTDGTDNVFAMASGVPTRCLKVLDNVMASCADGGGTVPDCGLWTRRPFMDYLSMYPSTVRYALQQGATSEFNFQAENIKHGQMSISWSDEFQHSGLGSNVDAAAGSELMYLLNTQTWNLLTESGWNFASRPWLPAQNQMASNTFVVWRGFLICTNPRKNAVVFDYNVS